jgi:hypothetical protein
VQRCGSIGGIARKSLKVVVGQQGVAARGPEAVRLRSKARVVRLLCELEVGGNFKAKKLGSDA